MEKFQCYYHKTISCNGREYIGKRIDTECFNTEIEAELYCRTHVGFSENKEYEMNYDIIEV